MEPDDPARFCSTYRGAIVEKVCEYMAFKSYYTTLAHKEEVPVHEFIDRIPPEVALELYVCF